jgi:hypothetical protein
LPHPPRFHSHCPASPTSARMFGECCPSQSLTVTYILGPYENLPWVGKACLYEQGHPEGRRRLARSTDGQAYRWETLNNIPRPCPTAQLWRPTKPCHIRNGAQITVNGMGQIFLRCLHSECSLRSSGQRWYIGTVPASLLLRRRQSESVAAAEQATSKIATHKRSAEENIEGASDRPHTLRSARRRNAPAGSR